MLTCACVADKDEVKILHPCGLHESWRTGKHVKLVGGGNLRRDYSA